MKTTKIPAIEIRHLSKSYHRGKKKKRILEDVSVTAQSGECIGILGINGCGKSTLLSILAGAFNPDGGEVLYQGKSLLTDNQRHLHCGYVPQDNPLLEELDAYDNLRLWYCDARLNLREELETGVLAMLGIPEFLHVKVSQMSGGMKKRLSIGCAMANDPPVLLLDEPGAALDLICKEAITDYLKQCRKNGKIIWLATHEPAEMALCDSLYLLQNGRLTPTEYQGDISHITNVLKQRRSS